MDDFQTPEEVYMFLLTLTVIDFGTIYKFLSISTIFSDQNLFMSHVHVQTSCISEQNI
jgi:hypothetical protein